MPSAVITLLTDFGERDGFVGTMKGVIHQQAPTAKVIDLTHNIPPQDVKAAAFVLHKSHRFFSMGTVHLAVVDPGVGSGRRPLAVKAGDYFFVAPDNGLLAYIFRDYPEAVIFAITNETYFLKPVSNTFHGRDVFAPASACLSAGIPIADLGEICKDYDRGEIPTPIRTRNGIRGQIIYLDRFGNATTNIPSDWLGQTSTGMCIRVADIQIRSVVTSYASTSAGDPLAIKGSSGYLEIAINRGSAQDKLGFSFGDSVEVDILLSAENE